MRILIASLFFCLATLSLKAQFPPQDTAFVRAHYLKREVRIPMRDGVTLHTVIYLPRDSSQTYPVLMKRTPYGVAPYGADTYPGVLGPTLDYAREKFIFVLQDVRGRFMSEGEFADVRPFLGPKPGKKEIDESTDTWDTVDWLLKYLSYDNGRVGIYGISYPGFYTAAGIVNTHPAIKAASPQAPVSDWFHGDDFHHNGVLFLPHAFNFYSGFGRKRTGLTTQWTPGYKHISPDGYKFFLELGALRNANEKYLNGEIEFWNQVMEHDTYDDFWQARNLNDHLFGVHCAVMTVGGWFDAENMYGALNVYRNIEQKNPGIANTLVMGPWSHGGWIRTEGTHLGDIAFNAKTSLYYQQKIELPFFCHYLKDKGEGTPPEAWVFETGANQWHSLPQWPPAEAQKKAFYLQPEGLIATSEPRPEGTTSYTKFDEYVSDPAHPVPYMTTIATGMLKEYMTADQRFAATRPDVLVYQTLPLETEPEGMSLTIAGSIEVEFYLSTTATDCDLIVKLIDVYPDTSTAVSPDEKVKMQGYQMIVRAEPFRCKFRNSFEHPEPMVPGQVTPIKFTMPDVYHTFLPGHRLMIQVQSTWFPLCDRNPQQFLDINQCTDSDFIKATQKVWHSPEYPSRILVNVLDWKK